MPGQQQEETHLEEYVYRCDFNPFGSHDIISIIIHNLMVLLFKFQ